MIRFFDIFFSIFGLIILSPIFLIIYLFSLFEYRSPIFKQERLGLNEISFTIFKFRTMRVDTLSVPTHLIDPSVISSYGKFLRVTKIDELPQLINVLFGDMSLVGPRPCLINQDELIYYRRKYHIFDVRPGITGYPQLNHIDMSVPQILVEAEVSMINNYGLISYFKCILLTIIGRGFRDGIGHN